MSESDNNNIKLYFHDKFCPLASGNTVWPSEDTLDIFVLMVAGLWIYAAILVRFIIDHENLPWQQLVHVLEFYLQ